MRATAVNRFSITGKILRILPFREIKVKESGEIKKVVDIIIADEASYIRISLWDDKAELALGGKIKVGDVLRIEKAYISGESLNIGEKRANTGKYTKIKKESEEMDALSLSAIKPSYLTVLAVARPEKEQICVAGIDECGNWIRPQGIYESDVFGGEYPCFKNLSISKIYVDEWKGKNPRKEDRFFISGEGIVKELSKEEEKEFLEKNIDASVDSVFKSSKSLGLIKPRILGVYEEKRREKGKEKSESRSYEQYIRFDFKDASGRAYRRWSCRCDAFYKAWNDLKKRHRWTYGLRMLRHLRKNNLYFTIGLTYTDYGVDKLEYRAYPMIVGVHVVQERGKSKP